MSESSIKRDLDLLAERHGPLEVAVIAAPEQFVPEPGVRRLAGAWAIELGVVSMKQPRSEAGDGLENIGALTLVLTHQTAAALHSFLTGLLEPGSRKRRPAPETLLPMVDPPPEPSSR
ncbi:MAG: hypothetical protein RMM58_04410 [Chloroflexota bacterium]|nr:hypothetical protein [Dehalococcoidia bacterium]MDW8253105.1 hypothetical protein [Chloroflexota bacterium]